MSSPCCCVAAIIARPIAAAMRPHGGKVRGLIRPSLPAHCGWRPIPRRQFRIQETSIDRPLKPCRYRSDEFQGRPADLQRGAESQNEPNCLGWPSVTSFRQIEANRRNARKSTGPTTEEGKQSLPLQCRPSWAHGRDGDRCTRGCRRLQSVRSGHHCGLRCPGPSSAGRSEQNGQRRRELLGRGLH
jgi:hypothetical protein